MSNQIYVNCINPECKKDLAEFEKEKQGEHPNTVKYRFCTSCRKKRWSIVLTCENCGVLSLEITHKYCKECAPLIAKSQQDERYLRLHPRGDCGICGIKLNPEEHGKRSKYCSKECMLKARSIMNKEWYKDFKNKPERLARRKQLQHRYWLNNKEKITAKNKIYRKTEKYKEYARKQSKKYYNEKIKNKYINIMIPKDKINDNVYILEKIRSKQ